MLTRRSHRKSLLLLAGTLALALWALHWLSARPYAPSPHPSPPAFEARVSPPLPVAVVPTVASAPALTAPDAGSQPSAPTMVEPRAVPVSRPVRPGLDTENVLLIGIDRHGAYKRGGRTDTLVVAAFDRGSDHVGLVSVPRDLYVTVEEHGPTRINAVYGLARIAKQDPLRALERVIEDTLGLPIAHSLAIDLEVFESAVDAVGGVEVEVDCAIDDNFLDARVEGGRRLLSLDAGPQWLDGATAGMFVRSRHGQSDFARARRQQAVLLALRRRLASIDGATRLPALLDGVEGSLETHMSRLELLALARRVLAVRPGHLHGVVLGHQETIGHRTEKNWSVLLPDPEAIEQKLGTLFSAAKPGERPRGLECVPRDAALRR